METRLAGLCATLAFAAAFVACRDSSTAPQNGPAARTPNFSTASASASQFHSVANGNSGFVQWFSSGSDGGSTFGDLSVGGTDSLTGSGPFLFYFIEQCDIFFNCNFFEGFGGIPNSDLSGGGKILHLSTNTSGNPNFFTFAGPTGLISVDWKANGFFQQRQSGTFEEDFPGFRFLSNGVSSSASANATGSVVGVSISLDNFGNIGSNHHVTIDIFH